MDDLVYDFIVGDEGHDLHPGSTDRTGEWIDLVDSPDENKSAQSEAVITH